MLIQLRSCRNIKSLTSNILVSLKVFVKLYRIFSFKSEQILETKEHQVDATESSVNSNSLGAKSCILQHFSTQLVNGISIYHWKV